MHIPSQRSKDIALIPAERVEAKIAVNTNMIMACKLKFFLAGDI